jgi:hypothetical protein
MVLCGAIASATVLAKSDEPKKDPKIPKAPELSVVGSRSALAILAAAALMAMGRRQRSTSAKKTAAAHSAANG